MLIGIILIIFAIVVAIYERRKSSNLDRRFAILKKEFADIKREAMDPEKDYWINSRLESESTTLEDRIRSIKK